MEYKGFEIKKTNSTYGNWAVHISCVHTEFFWHKKDAIRFIDNHIKDLKNGERQENEF